MIWRILWPLLLAAFLAIVSVNFLIGLPGAFFIDALLPREDVLKMGPGGWAAAIYVSFLAPFGIAPALWLMTMRRPQAPWWQWLGAAFAGYFTAGAIATFNIA